MNKSPDDRFAIRARVGVGASIGTVLGAALAALLIDTTQATLIGSALGAAGGAMVGSRLKSEAFQFFWVEKRRNCACVCNFFEIKSTKF